MLGMSNNNPAAVGKLLSPIPQCECGHYDNRGAPCKSVGRPPAVQIEQGAAYHHWNDEIGYRQWFLKIRLGLLLYTVTSYFAARIIWARYSGCRQGF